MAAPMGSMCLVIFLLISLVGCDIENSNQVQIISNAELINSIRESQYLVVLFYGAACDTVCKKYLGELKSVADTTMLANLKIARNEGNTIAHTYGVTSYPQIVYFRNGYPILYDYSDIEAESITVWIEQNQVVTTRTLTDHSFEHDTQASTGATTGDWFVMFYNSNCNKLLASMETISSRLKHQLNVAKVDISKNLGLKNRFSITKCPSFIYFRHGKMYVYNLPDKDHNSLSGFASGFYRNVKADDIPTEATPFDALTSAIADMIKEYLDGPHGTYYMLCGTFAVFLVLLSCLLCLTSSGKGTKYD